MPGTDEDLLDELFGLGATNPKKLDEAQRLERLIEARRLAREEAARQRAQSYHSVNFGPLVLMDQKDVKSNRFQQRQQQQQQQQQAYYANANANYGSNQKTNDETLEKQFAFIDQMEKSGVYSKAEADEKRTFALTEAEFRDGGRYVPKCTCPHLHRY